MDGDGAHRARPVPISGLFSTGRAVVGDAMRPPLLLCYGARTRDTSAGRVAEEGLYRLHIVDDLNTGTNGNNLNGHGTGVLCE